MSDPSVGVTTPDRVGTDQDRSEGTDVQRLAREAVLSVPGVHALGTDSRRRLASALGRVPGASRVSLSPGVNAETGPTQTAIDLTVIVEAGVDILDLGQRVRREVGDAVLAGSGHAVVEVNVDVIDVHDPEGEAEDQAAAPAPHTSEPDVTSGSLPSKERN